MSVEEQCEVGIEDFFALAGHMSLFGFVSKKELRARFMLVVIGVAIARLCGRDVSERYRRADWVTYATASVRDRGQARFHLHATT